MAIASLLKTLGGRRSIENPATSLADPANWLIDAAGGGRSAAGTSVTRATALTHAAVWRAVNLVAGDIGTMPVHVMRREGAGKVRDTKHAAYRLLRYQACAEVSSGVLREVLQGHVLLEGNGYAYIYRDGAGRPMEIVPLAPHSITPVRYQGELRYIYRATGADAVKLLPENVIHIKGYSEDGLVGYSVLAKAKESLGLGLGAREYGARFLSNNARPAMVLEH
ncbi:MAG TPA: phage portal protein, partial [Phycisphaerae bacterium]|nr:phage portal protein [Phycisphaerae bacterium]